jgi:tRNA modification GTPase
MKLRKLPCNKCAGFSMIAKLREEFKFPSLINWSWTACEEDVEFADRTQFHELLNRIEFVLKRLIDSFAVGNVIKKRYSCGYC